MARIKMQLGIMIGICARDLGIGYHEVTPATLHQWASRPKNRSLFGEPLTLEQAKHIIEHPTELANTVDEPKGD